MTSLIVRVAALAAVFLAVLGSLAPADVLIGLVLAAVIVVVGNRLSRSAGRPIRPPGTSPARRLAGLPALLGGTLVDLARGTWQTAAFSVGRGSWSPGLVAVDIPPTVEISAAVWALRVGIAPDSVVVEVDEQRGRILLHVIDARDPEGLRRDVLEGYRRRQQRVFP